jgi:hypothetical protein
MRARSLGHLRKPAHSLAARAGMDNEFGTVELELRDRQPLAILHRRFMSNNARHRHV